MFDWDDLRLFLAVARSGGLGPAADSTGKSPPTLGRRLLALERRLGLDLFRRLPRGYELTEQGRILLDKVAAIEAAVTPIVASRRPAPPTVKISAGQWVTDLLCRRVPELTAGDDVTLRFIATDDVLDMGHREAVIGIRNARPHQSGLAGRRIGQVRFALYAVDETVETWARVVGATPSARWIEANIGDAPFIELTNPRNALDLALAGAARAVLPTFIGARQAGLKALGPVIAELDHDQWLVSHHEDRFLPEIRRTIHRIYAMLRTELQPSHG